MGRENVNDVRTGEDGGCNKMACRVAGVLEEKALKMVRWGSWAENPERPLTDALALEARDIVT
jgi:hypothetical protein